MPVTMLDARTALLVVDLQKGIVRSAAADLSDDVPSMPEVLHRVRALIDAFRRHALPVVLINVAGGAPGRTDEPARFSGSLPEGFTDFVAELGQRPEDIVVTKRSWGAFANTDLDARLRAIDITQVVVCGVATGAGVEATARQAFEQGYNVTLAIDAMTDRRAVAHRYSIDSVFPRLGETGTAQDIVDLLDARNV
ncbi:isochorismatase family protein [Segnochrobactrum spirostomi]|uniref:Isochorismatase family protein n=1 Tax=Segnochrobactrum spirostomi TaxID=2608987 RepID=A0A6A7XY39_9HYPH|nr:isochorismatase family protein [Segnochrobactrum spirostomi]MQT11610.1 isochorismatase family protein [Segnochrobactrum spirostomi]